jgi:4-hydroxy-4-methyl-2-oxoglutarate aldolase
MVMAYDVPISCGGVLVKPSNLIFADFDGIVVVPNEVEQAVFVQAKEKVRKEDLSNRELLEGKSLREVFMKYGVL